MTQNQTQPLLSTRRCTFKLHGPLLDPLAIRPLHAMAAAWISRPTAGFVLGAGQPHRLALFWWEGARLLRCLLARDPERGGDYVRAPEAALHFAEFEEIALIAFEARSWSRHGMGQPADRLAAYLKDLPA